ncbi:MAG: diaminopimelate decarboxylase [Fibrobacterota bacterium]
MLQDNWSHIHHIWTKDINFFGDNSPFSLLEKYGSPLYVYNEGILRTRCREIKNLLSYPRFGANYSAKANTNLKVLQIVREEGLTVDAMSPGELYLELQAGFSPQDIFFIPNNVSDDEFRYAIEEGVLVSVDSLSQLRRYGKLNPGGKVAVRMNPGIGAGHHEKVITAGTKTKFGIDPLMTNDLKAILRENSLQLVGLNQHVGSLFMDSDAYVNAARFLLSYAELFPEVEFVDFGGGFGVPYRKEEGEKRLDLKVSGERLDRLVKEWVEKTGREITVKVEPGRYISAEFGILLGQVNAIKKNGGKTYVGTDIGFNVLVRPAMYDSHHDIEVYGAKPRPHADKVPVTIVGNICETGDIVADDRLLPPLQEGDILGVLDSGAYGMVMASNYNSRLRPAEVLISESGEDILIRRRDSLEDLKRGFPPFS